MKKKKQKSNKRQEGRAESDRQKGRAERRGERVDAARYLCTCVQKALLPNALAWWWFSHHGGYQNAKDRRKQ